MAPDPSIPVRRKRTATKRATENGDPLVASKKARDAAKKTPRGQASFYLQSQPSLVDHLLTACHCRQPNGQGLYQSSPWHGNSGNTSSLIAVECCLLIYSQRVLPVAGNLLR